MVDHFSLSGGGRHMSRDHWALSVCLSACLTLSPSPSLPHSVCLSVYLSVCLSLSLSLSLRFLNTCTQKVCVWCPPHSNWLAPHCKHITTACFTKLRKVVFRKDNPLLVLLLFFGGERMKKIYVLIGNSVFLK